MAKPRTNFEFEALSLDRCSKLLRDNSNSTMLKQVIAALKIVQAELELELKKRD